MNKQPTVIGIDLAKAVFHIVRMDRRGATVLRKRLARAALMDFIIAAMAEPSPSIRGSKRREGAVNRCVQGAPTACPDSP